LPGTTEEKHNTSASAAGLWAKIMNMDLPKEAGVIIATLQQSVAGYHPIFSFQAMVAIQIIST
jgi:hypothetical protein